MSKEINCSKCTGNMIFGGASRGMVKAMGGMKAIMASMAIQAGWSKAGRSGGWLCRDCK